MKNLSLILLAIFLFSTGSAFAHQPRLVENNTVEIKNPEVSQAFYGELRGSPCEFRIQSNKDFRLYVGLLIPDIPNIQKDISAEIYRVKDGKNEMIALLDGSHFAWTPFFEEFARDHYFWGPEYKADDSQTGIELKGRLVPAGDYRIKVFSPSNFGKYTLVTGFLEVFPFAEIVNAAIIVPRLKAQFFGYPLSELVTSPYVLGYLLVIFALAFIAGSIFRFIVKKFARDSVVKTQKNIGKADRLVRVVIGLGLIIWAVTTTWSPILFFLSGLVFFEAIFSWSVLYAAFGRNTCLV